LRSSLRTLTRTAIEPWERGPSPHPWHAALRVCPGPGQTAARGARMIIREKVRIGDQVVTLETGRIAKQAGGSCLVRAGDTVVLVTVCGNTDPKPGQSFFPLSVDY